MKIFLTIVITLLIISVITILLIKKSVKTQDTKVDWTALANGNLTVNVKMNLLLPFAVTLEEFKVLLGAGGTVYFSSDIGTLKLNPGFNIIQVTFKPDKPLDLLSLAALVTQKKFININGYVLGLSFERTEEL